MTVTARLVIGGQTFRFFHIPTSSIPVIPRSTLSSCNFPGHVLRLWLQSIRAFTFIFSPFTFTGWISSRIWTVWSSILIWNSWIPDYSSLIKSFCCYCNPTIVISHCWTNNFPRSCSTCWRECYLVINISCSTRVLELGPQVSMRKGKRMHEWQSKIPRVPL